jgi:UPF0755 protein
MLQSSPALTMNTAQRLSKWFFYLVLFPATLGVCAWQGWAWWSWASAPPLVPLTQTTASPENTSPENSNNPATAIVQIKIPEGTSAQQIGRDLESAGLIRSAIAWNLWTRWQLLRDRSGSFLAGTYELSPSETLPAIAAKVWQGEVAEQSFTIPEGWSIQQMAEYFEDKGYFPASDFLTATQKVPAKRYPWLPAQLPHLEGFLFPDTYKVSRNMNPEALIDIMLDRFEQVALPVYQQQQTAYSLGEWVTLASIVEKEAVVDVERPQIASVFARRLREDIPLGADPTVEYAFGIRQAPGKPLTLTQVNTPSPYNTYLNSGLPPTAIASPGLASLEAALTPKDTEYLYFVARYDGTHVFSRTLADHEAAQAAIQDELASQSQTKPGLSN